MPLLTVKGLKTHFQTQEGTVRAVDGVDFTLGEGESLGLAGESGCGKTTAALSIMRLLPSNGKIVDGTIDYVGYDLAKVTEGQLRAIRWKHISIIFQGAMNALNPVKRIGDQIAEPIVIHDKVDKEVAMKRVGELLELVGIHRERAQEYPHEFSGGMRQRVMIAMILISHDLSVMAETCDSMAIMYAGKIVERGSVRDVYKNAKHPYTKDLIGAFPDIEGPQTLPAYIPGLLPSLINPPLGCRFHPRCKFAWQLCIDQEPGLDPVGEGHLAACHLNTTTPPRKEAA